MVVKSIPGEEQDAVYCETRLPGYGRFWLRKVSPLIILITVLEPGLGSFKIQLSILEEVGSANQPSPKYAQVSWSGWSLIQ